MQRLILFVALSIPLLVSAQKFTAEKGEVSFFSDAPLEDIKATNNLVGSLFNSGTGEVVFIMKMKDFVFAKALMREHFNEKYMESEKFPKATFQGKISGFKNELTGPQKVRAAGKLSMHGLTRDIDVPGTLEFGNGKVVLKSRFVVKLKDFNITIPSIVWQNISEDVEVNIDLAYRSL